MKNSICLNNRYCFKALFVFIFLNALHYASYEWQRVQKLRIAVDFRTSFLLQLYPCDAFTFTLFSSTSSKNYYLSRIEECNDEDNGCDTGAIPFVHDDEQNYYLSGIEECNDEDDGCDDDLDEHNLKFFWNIGDDDDDEDEEEHHILSISKPSSCNGPSGSYAAQVQQSSQSGNELFLK
ncbi:hypothetical protein VNO77_07841 [Canavalia gladiata]|uniref:Uncharacterized protein n=1 Tax=Canavalia gladiata TaxID=3824 RepID=A0AAN9M7Z0_CANGL